MTIEEFNLKLKQALLEIQANDVPLRLMISLFILTPRRLLVVPNLELLEARMGIPSLRTASLM